MLKTNTFPAAQICKITVHNGQQSATSSGRNAGINIHHVLSEDYKHYNKLKAGWVDRSIKTHSYSTICCKRTGGTWLAIKLAALYHHILDAGVSCRNCFFLPFVNSIQSICSIFQIGLAEIPDSQKCWNFCIQDKTSECRPAPWEQW